MSSLDKFTFSSRNDYKDFILFIEANFSINDWKLSDIHLWPIIRIRLFFYLINTFENATASPKNDKNNNVSKRSIVTQAKSYLYQLKQFLEYKQSLKSLTPVDKVYFSAYTHRVTEQGKFFNKFFDAQRVVEEDTSSYYYMEYMYKSDQQYWQESHVLNFRKYLKTYLFFNKGSVALTLNGYADFMAYLSQYDELKGFVKDWNEEALRYNAPTYWGYYNFYKSYFKTLKPKEVSYLCYYNSIDLMFGVAAANKLGIITTEMQHGPQTEIHLAYGSWSNLPREGYDMLPRTFLHWEPSTSDILQKWMQKNSLYKTVVVGHPWIEYLSQSYNIKIEEPFILFCLQPAPVTIEETFPTPLIEHIKQGNIKWYIRLHPRQMDSYEDIKSFLSNNGLNAYVNLDDATQLPLPVLIKDTKAVVTLFSGSVLEAEMMNKPSIILSEIGRMNFKAQIEAGSAVYIDPTDNNFASHMTTIFDKIDSNA